MQGQEIFGPFFGMMLLTLFVWIVLYVRRISYLKANRIHAQKLATPEKVAQVIPDEVQYPANNFKNLFELPVLFYLLCLYLFVSGNVDSWYVMGAWAYVALRAIHSFVQCTTNIVMRRFVVYMASSIVLWVMVLRAALYAF
jgi:hypothetical protein